MSKDWQEKIKAGERLTPNERAQSFVTYIAWAILPDARKIVEQRLTGVIEAAELEAESVGESKRYEYAVIYADVAHVVEAQNLQYRLNQEADRGFEPIDFQPNRIIMRRKSSRSEVE